MSSDRFDLPHPDSHFVHEEHRFPCTELTVRSLEAGKDTFHLNDDIWGIDKILTEFANDETSDESNNFYTEPKYELLRRRIEVLAHEIKRDVLADVTSQSVAKLNFSTAKTMFPLSGFLLISIAVVVVAALNYLTYVGWVYFKMWQHNRNS